MRLSSTRRVALAALLACAGAAFAQGAPWPAKPVRLIVAAPAGSAPDLIARIMGDKLGRQLGQSFVIDNRPGAGGIIAMNLLKSSAPDGYTLALPQAAVVVVTPSTYKEATYDPERDFETVAMVGKTPMLFVAHANHPAKSFADAVAMAKAKPDTVSIGNPTRTSIPHLASELAGQKMDAKFQQISFANTPQGVQAVVNGDINLYVDGVGPLLPLSRAGKVRALAVASETELPGLEGIPLANKTVPGLNVYGWFILQAPKGTPTPILQRLNTEVNKAMQEADVVAKFREFGTYPTPGDLAASQRFLASEKALFGGVIRSLGLKPE
ncbi:MAG TPA: tripartite tricarboxylate transporter substrate binding protein [Ramlibacter sp.]|nr:tripartite tricarboxylate transporter substrate binding protein [Ramlibacter sp.]